MAAVWSDEVVSQLKEYASQGLSASQAASQFDGMTRNAAVGLAHRKSFHFLGHKSSRNNRASIKTKPRCEKVEPSEVRPGMLTIMELTHDDCKYIFGVVQDPNHRYCGQKRHGDYPWCGEHARLCYEPRENRSAPTPYR